MKKLLLTLFIVTVAVAGIFSVYADDTASKPNPFSKTIYQAGIHGVEDKEIVVSLVELPPGNAAPLHTHPGEEFAFIIEGEAIQNVDNRGEEVKLPGQVVHIPYGVVHTVRTGTKPLKALVFRIHEKGKPERNLVNE